MLPIALNQSYCVLEPFLTPKVLSKEGDVN